MGLIDTFYIIVALALVALAYLWFCLERGVILGLFWEPVRRDEAPVVYWIHISINAIAAALLCLGILNLAFDWGG